MIIWFKIETIQYVQDFQQGRRSIIEEKVGAVLLLIRKWSEIERDFPGWLVVELFTVELAS